MNIILTDKGLGVIEAPKKPQSENAAEWNRYQAAIQQAIDKIVYFKDKKPVYVAMANRGLSKKQLLDNSIAWSENSIDEEQFERTFLQKGKPYPIPDGYDVKTKKDYQQKEGTNTPYAFVEYAILVPKEKTNIPYPINQSKHKTLAELEDEEYCDVLEKIKGAGDDYPVIAQNSEEKGDGLKIEVCEDCPYNTHPCPEGCSSKQQSIEESKVYEDWMVEMASNEDNTTTFKEWLNSKRQTSIEEAADSYKKQRGTGYDNIPALIRECYIAGAKWKDEQPVDKEQQKVIWDSLLHDSKYNLGYVGGLKAILETLSNDFTIQFKQDKTSHDNR